MKTLTATFQEHLAGGLLTVAWAWKITCTNGNEYFFTDHDTDLLIDGDIYESVSGAVGTSLSHKLNLSVDNMEITGFLESTKISEALISAGVLDYATVDIYLVNWADFEITQVT